MGQLADRRRDTCHSMPVVRRHPQHADTLLKQPCLKTTTLRKGAGGAGADAAAWWRPACVSAAALQRGQRPDRRGAGAGGPLHVWVLCLACCMTCPILGPVTSTEPDGAGLVSGSLLRHDLGNACALYRAKIVMPGTVQLIPFLIVTTWFWVACAVGAPGGAVDADAGPGYWGRRQCSPALPVRRAACQVTNLSTKVLLCCICLHTQSQQHGLTVGCLETQAGMAASAQEPGFAAQPRPDVTIRCTVHPCRPVGGRGSALSAPPAA